MDFRKNYLTEEVVLMAAERENRPMDYVDKVEKYNMNPKDCAFCLGNEHMTPDMVYESPNKHCRIIKNKYPAINEATGLHEVIIDTCEHTKKLYEQSIDEFLETLIGLKTREEHHYNVSKVKYVQIFKNNGRQAGASMEHSHFQLIGMNYVPDKINTITKNFKKHREKNNSCYLCSLEEGKHCFTIYDNDEFRAVTMYDAVYAFCIDILPKKHITCLHKFSDTSLQKLSDCILKSLQSLEKVKKNLDYNILFFSNLDENFHFHLKIVPRKGKFGGFELSSGNYICSVLPEKAMEILKENL